MKHRLTGKYKDYFFEDEDGNLYKDAFRDSKGRYHSVKKIAKQLGNAFKVSVFEDGRRKQVWLSMGEIDKMIRN